MTAPRLNLTRPTQKPAANLFRVTAVVAALTLPLLWLWHLWTPLPSGSNCSPQDYCPAVEVVDAPLTAFLGWTTLVELAVVVGYLAVAGLRGTLRLRTGLRWLPIALSILVLALGGFVALMDTAGPSALFAVWLATPAILFGVHRGDRRAVLPVLLGLAPTAISCATLVTEVWLAGLPVAVLIACAIGWAVSRR
jgi:hypothetical protein